MFTNYHDARDWLESFIPYTYSKSNLGLERIKHLLKLLGNPQEKFKSIHVAGTSGKGSCAFYLARALHEAQKLETRNSKLETNTNDKNSKLQNKISDFPTKVGLHISPHLVYIGERMQIFQSQKSKVKGQRLERDGEIPVKRLVGLINEIKPVVEAIKSKQPDLIPSYFEILVAASFLYFAQEKVDIAVVEAGLGGRLDATNVLQPLITVITNVGLDHTEILGNTIEEIAREKAGIIKEVIRLSGDQVVGNKIGVPVVTGAGGKALEVIKKVARSKKSKVITKSTLNAEDRSYLNHLVNFKEQFDTVYGDSIYVTDECFFLVNLVLAELGIRLTDADQLKAFTANFEGRFEEIDDGIIIDGAHNRDKVKVLINWVKNRQQETRNKKQETRITLVCAFKKGKDWKGMLKLLLTNLDINSVIATWFVIPTDTGFFAAVDPEEIAEFLNVKCQMSNVKCFNNSQEAVWEVLRLRSGSSTLVLITGSLYLAGEARTIWELPPY